jgi:hypothetical protein
MRIKRDVFQVSRDVPVECTRDDPRLRWRVERQHVKDCNKGECRSASGEHFFLRVWSSIQKTAMPKRIEARQLQQIR